MSAYIVANGTPCEVSPTVSLSGQMLGCYNRYGVGRVSGVSWEPMASIPAGKSAPCGHAWRRPLVGPAEEVQQGAVDLVGVGPGDGVRAAVDDHRLHVADQAGQAFAGLRVGQDPVVIAMDDQHRHVDLGRSARKSVSQVGMQATAAVAEAVTARFQLAW